MKQGFAIGDRILGLSGDTHPDWSVAHAVLQSYQIIGASAAGKLHLAKGTPRDDAFAIRSYGPWLAVGVSDGVGSRPLSRYGATYVAEALASLLLRSFVPSLQDELKASEGASPSSKTSNSSLPYQESNPNIPDLNTIREKLKSFETDDFSSIQNQEYRHKKIAEMLCAWMDLLSEEISTSSSNNKSNLTHLQQAASLGWYEDNPVLDDTRELKELSKEAIVDREGDVKVKPNLESIKLPVDQQPQLDTGENAAQLGQEQQLDADNSDVSSNTTEQGKTTNNLAQVNNVEAENTSYLEEKMRQAFKEVHQSLSIHAKYLGVDLRDLSCTALGLLLNVETGEVAVGQVGDGVILGLTAQKEIEHLVEAENTGDSQSTYTINHSDFEQHLKVKSMSLSDRDFQSLFVMTDGVSEDVIYSEPSALNKWGQAIDNNLRNSANLAESSAGMLNWLATYHIPGSWDDRTLIVITKNQDTPECKK